MKQRKFKLPGKLTLRKELAIALTIKAILIFLIWRAFFAHPAIDQMNANTEMNHMLGNQSFTVAKPMKSR